MCELTMELTKKGINTYYYMIIKLHVPEAISLFFFIRNTFVWHVTEAPFWSFTSLFFVRYAKYIFPDKSLGIPNLAFSRIYSFMALLFFFSNIKVMILLTTDNYLNILTWKRTVINCKLRVRYIMLSIYMKMNWLTGSKHLFSAL